jgi:gamma-glutamyltranspeptidase/glutathione hydrolase
VKKLLRLALFGTVGLVLVVLAGVGGLKAYWASTDPSTADAPAFRSVPAAPVARATVAAADPRAVDAALAVLEEGGSALDAAIAAQMVLTLVEPMASGIGGGAFLLYWDASSDSLLAWDGRETAPAGATPELFFEDGEPLHIVEALPGGRSVGVPGAVRMLERAHGEHGSLAWSRLFDDAIRLAEEGTEVSPLLHHFARLDPWLRSMPAGAGFYDDDGFARPAGETHKNPALAGTLRSLRDQGADALHTGPIASDIVDAVRGARRPSFLPSVANFIALKLGAPAGLGITADVDNVGLLTLDDLAGYQPKQREPVCARYRRWRVCGMPPPTSGGVAALQMLGVLERFDLAKLGPRAPATAHLLAEASRLAFADREVFVGDPDFVDVPTKGLVDAAYLKSRAALVREDARLAEAKAGTPPGAKSAAATGRSLEQPSTSHLTVVDGAGNVASMTTSVEAPFGSHLVVRGFVLNNQLTDFSFRPQRDGRQVANGVAAGKRPRSSMTPLIVFDAETGEPVLAVGSPGGPRIIGYTVRALTGVLDFGLSPQEAVELPHVICTGDAVEVEDRGWAEGEREAVTSHLEQLGHEVKVGPLMSGIHAVQLTAEGTRGGADPRRGGVARGTHKVPALAERVPSEGAPPDGGPAVSGQQSPTP